jgi:hypothetical protein
VRPHALSPPHGDARFLQLAVGLASWDMVGVPPCGVLCALYLHPLAASDQLLLMLFEGLRVCMESKDNTVKKVCHLCASLCVKHLVGRMQADDCAYAFDTDYRLQKLCICF